MLERDRHVLALSICDPSLLCLRVGALPFSRGEAALFIMFSYLSGEGFQQSLLYEALAIRSLYKAYASLVPQWEVGHRTSLLVNTSKRKR